MGHRRHHRADRPAGTLVRGAHRTARARLLRHLRFHRAQRSVAPAGCRPHAATSTTSSAAPSTRCSNASSSRRCCCARPSAASRTICARRCTACACGWRRRCCATTVPRNRELVGPALEELDRVQRTLATLLEIARAEGGSTVAGSEAVDVGQLAHEMFELYQPGMQDKGLEFTLDAAAGITMMGKRQLLAQLIANLLENAMKYVPPGGHVWLEVQAQPERVLLSVADDGPGIAAQDRERAQQPFVRLDESAQPRQRPRAEPGARHRAAAPRRHRARRQPAGAQDQLLVSRARRRAEATAPVPRRCRRIPRCPAGSRGRTTAGAAPRCHA